jgi:hypothetical protein
MTLGALRSALKPSRSTLLPSLASGLQSYGAIDKQADHNNQAFLKQNDVWICWRQQRTAGVK